MFENSSDPKYLGQIVGYLDSAATKLTEFSKPQKVVSSQDLKELITILNNFNSSVDSRFLESKKMVLEEMSSSVEDALQAVLMFQNLSKSVKASQRNVDQAIVALGAVLKRELKEFDKRLRQIRLGRKIEKSNKSKNA